MPSDQSGYYHFYTFGRKRNLPNTSVVPEKRTNRFFFLCLNKKLYLREKGKHYLPESPANIKAVYPYS